MRRIYKYPLRSYYVEMYEGAEVIYVGMQDDTITLWARVDTDAPKVIRHFAVIGTGHSFDEEENLYIGSVFDGPFVWHIHENTQPLVVTRTS